MLTFHFPYTVINIFISTGEKEGDQALFSSVAMVSHVICIPLSTPASLRVTLTLKNLTVQRWGSYS